MTNWGRSLARYSPPAPLARSLPETLLQLARREQLRVHRRSNVELLRCGERPDHDRFEPGVLHQTRGNVHRLGVVRGDWNPHELTLPVRFAAQVAIANCIEGAHEADAREEL